MWRITTHDCLPLRCVCRRVKTVVQTEMQSAMTDGAAMLKSKISEVTKHALVV
eukprot:COSAG02_NODE_8617_length_2503_cov_6.137271_3_plen_53_part_00